MSRPAHGVGKCVDCGDDGGSMVFVYGVALRVLCKVCADRMSEDLQSNKPELARLLQLSKQMAGSRQSSDHARQYPKERKYV